MPPLLRDSREQKRRVSPFTPLLRALIKQLAHCLTSFPTNPQTPSPLSTGVLRTDTAGNLSGHASAPAHRPEIQFSARSPHRVSAFRPVETAGAPERAAPPPSDTRGWAIEIASVPPRIEIASSPPSANAPAEHSPPTATSPVPSSSSATSLGATMVPQGWSITPVQRTRAARTWRRSSAAPGSAPAPARRRGLFESATAGLVEHGSVGAWDALEKSLRAEGHLCAEDEALLLREEVRRARRALDGEVPPAPVPRRAHSAPRPCGPCAGRQACSGGARGSQCGTGRRSHASAANARTSARAPRGCGSRGTALRRRSRPRARCTTMRWRTRGGGAPRGRPRCCARAPPV